MENLRAEVSIREREGVREELGSDYSTDSDREDVTKAKKSNKPRRGFQPESEQREQMHNILKDFSKNKLDKRPTFD